MRTLDGEDCSLGGDITGVDRDAVHVHHDLLQCSGHTIGVRSVGHDIERFCVDPPDDDVVDDGGIFWIKKMRVLRTT